MRSLFLIFISSCLALIGCDLIKPKVQVSFDDSVATVGDNRLSTEELAQVVKNAGNKADSATVASTYVNEWVKRKLLIQKAKQYLPTEMLDVEMQVDQYRESLILFRYEQELVRQKLDTSISKTELQEQYDQNAEQYQLENSIAQVFYVKFPKQVSKLQESRKWFRKFDTESKQLLTDHCFQAAIDFSLTDTTWYNAGELEERLPVKKLTFYQLSINQGMVQVADSAYLYLIRTKGYRRQGEPAPLSYVEKDIRRIILNKRKKSLLNSTYERIYRDGQNSTQ